MKKVAWLFISLFLAASVFAVGSRQGGGGEKYPTKQIRMIVQANPGGGSDINCRTIAPGVEAILGVPVVPENRPGGGGAVAFSYGATQPADGYTISHVAVDLAILKPTNTADVSPEQFNMICRVAYMGAGIAVRADSKYRNLNDFIADAKARPGEIMIGNSGLNTLWHLSGVQFENAVGIKMSHVPFEGVGPCATALLGGHIDALVAAPPEVASQVLGEQFRLLAVFYDERLPLFPDAPTLKELGIDLTCLNYMGFGVPRGTPRDVINTLADAFKKSYDSDVYQEMLKSRGFTPGWMGPEEFDKFIQADYEKYLKLIPTL